jgi:hypothetical protein
LPVLEGYEKTIYEMVVEMMAPNPSKRPEAAKLL